MLAQAFPELARERFGIRSEEYTNSGQLGLLCGKRQRPKHRRGRRAAEEGDELTPSHGISSR